LIAVNAMGFLNLAFLVYSLTNSPVGVPAESIQNAVRPYQQKLKYRDHIPPIAMPLASESELKWVHEQSSFLKDGIGRPNEWPPGTLQRKIAEHMMELFGPPDKRKGPGRP
jgi:hypothetical protein